MKILLFFFSALVLISGQFMKTQDSIFAEVFKILKLKIINLILVRLAASKQCITECSIPSYVNKQPIK